MAEFAYLALDTQGRERRGQLAANDVNDARARLTGRKLYVVKVEAAAGAAREAGLAALHVDALHMVALVAPPEEALERSHAALAVARASESEAARDWDASLLNNIGMTYADAEDWGAALAAFEDALEARERIGDDGRTRVAKWMVGWALRNLGRTDEALVLQTAFKAELEAVGEEDPYVDEELALLSG